MTPLRCALFGHRWDRDPLDVPDGTIFRRVDCTRPGCDYKMDAAALKRTMSDLPARQRERVERSIGRGWDES